VCPERGVKARWQPQIRAKARQKATTDGIIIDTHARLGCPTPIGSTDQDRTRLLTVDLPPRHAARLFDAQEAGAGERCTSRATAAAPAGRRKCASPTRIPIEACNSHSVP